MKRILLTIALVICAPSAFATEPFCDTGKSHPIDLQLRRDLDQSGGVTVDIREAQGTAYQGWDRELNREYRELMALLSEADKPRLRDAQRAWLAFQEQEKALWWSEISGDGGTLQPIVVSDIGLGFLRERVCRLARYKAALQ